MQRSPDKASTFILLALLAFLMLPSVALPAAVTFLGDVNQGKVPGGTRTSDTFSTTVPAGSDRLLVVHVAVEQGAVSDLAITGVTYDGTPMTEGPTGRNPALSASRGPAALWYLALGTGDAITAKNVVVTYSDSVSGTAIFGAATFASVDQTTPVDNVTSTDFTTTITPSHTVTSESGDMVVGGIYSGAMVFSAGAGQTIFYAQAGSSDSMGASMGAMSYKNGASSVTMSWAISTSEPQRKAGTLLGMNLNVSTGGAPEIDVQGNSVSIADEDTTPDSSDHTDFGSANVDGGTVERTFTIENTGEATLTINSVASDNAEFAVSGAPSIVAVGGSETFTVTFDPSATGSRTATITIDNDDADEGTYTFAVAGTGATEVTAGTVGGGDGQAGDTTPDGFTIRLNMAGTMIEIEQDGSVQTFPVNTPLIINGSDDDDTLTIDFTNGNPIPASGLVFNGGGEGAGGDTLVVMGGTHTTATYNFDNASDGSIDLDGAMIAYTGLEPIVNSGTVTDAVFNYSGVGETIVLSDLGGGMSRLTSTAAETTDFANPSNSLTVNAGGGDDTITVASIGFNPTLGIGLNGEAGDDIVNLSKTVAATAAFGVDGGAHTAGDTLNFDREGDDNITDGGTPISGGGIMAVDYADIETPILSAVFTIAATSATQAEGDGGGTTAFTFTVTRTGDTSAASTVSFSVAGSGGTPASAGDFAATSGNVSFAATDTTKVLTVDVNADGTVEPNEGFTTALTGASAGDVSINTPSATGTINNDDAASITLAAGSVAESSAQTFTVSIDNPVDTAVTVEFDTLGSGTATAGSDFTAVANQVVTFPANSTTDQTVNVTVADDQQVEGDETVAGQINTLNASGRNVAIGTAAATGTIDDNDTATLNLAANTNVSEDSGVQTITVTLVTSDGAGGTATLGAGITLTANVTDAGGGTATVTTDYAFASPQGVSFGPGSGNGATDTVNITPASENLVELNETVNLNLGALNSTLNGQAALGTLNGTATIINNDSASITINNVAFVREGHPAPVDAIAAPTRSFTVSLSNPVDVNVTVRADTAGGGATDGVDYNSIVNQTVTFNAGTTTGQTVTVTIVEDNTDEGFGNAVETFFVNLSNLMNGGRSVSVGDSQGFSGIINDDFDVTLTASTSPDPTEGTPSEPFTFSYTLSTDLGVPVVAGDTLTLSDSEGDFAADNTLAIVANGGVVKSLTTIGNHTLTLAYAGGVDGAGNQFLDASINESHDVNNKPFIDLTPQPVASDPAIKSIHFFVQQEAGPQPFNIADFIISETPGLDEKAVQNLALTIANDNPGLFAVPPAITAPTTIINAGEYPGSSDLTFTVAPNVNGRATVTITATDDGAGMNFTNKSFHIDVMFQKFDPGELLVVDRGTHIKTGKIMGLKTQGPVQKIFTTRIVSGYSAAFTFNGDYLISDYSFTARAVEFAGGLLLVDRLNGGVTRVAGSNPLSVPVAIVEADHGTLATRDHFYVADAGADPGSIYDFDLNTGGITLLSRPGPGGLGAGSTWAFPFGMVRDGTDLYVTASSEGSATPSSIVKVDTTTGDRTTVLTLETTNRPVGIDIDRVSNLLVYCDVGSSNVNTVALATMGGGAGSITEVSGPANYLFSTNSKGEPTIYPPTHVVVRTNPAGTLEYVVSASPPAGAHLKPEKRNLWTIDLTAPEIQTNTVSWTQDGFLDQPRGLRLIPQPFDP